MRIFPDTAYIPEGFPNPGDKVDYEESIRKLLKLQKNLCPVCQKLICGICDRHEGIVTKGDVQGWPKPWRIVIINPYNCVYVHRDCHQHGLRDFFWKHKCEIFGEDEMRKWYYSLPFKVFPRRF